MFEVAITVVDGLICLSIRLLIISLLSFVCQTHSPTNRQTKITTNYGIVVLFAVEDKYSF